MPFQNNYSGRTFVADTTTFDIGLRRHMISVYNYMMAGLLVSGLIAWYISHDLALVQQLAMSPARKIIPWAPLVFMLVLQFGIRNLSVVAAQLLFFAFSATMGVSLTWIFLTYATGSIAQIFFVSAAMFAGTSLYGYTTKANLTSMGSFMIMGLWGIVISSVLNILILHSPVLDLVMSIVSVLVFTGLTAYSTQAIRNNYSAGYGVSTNTKIAILSALTLYLNFLNLFLTMLRLFGQRRS